MILENSITRRYSYPADVWSFGITVIEMATTEPPNLKKHAMTVLYVRAFELQAFMP